MFTVAPYRIGTEVMVENGPNRGQRGTVLERSIIEGAAPADMAADEAQPVVLGGHEEDSLTEHPGSEPGPQAMSWSYLVQLENIDEEVTVLHEQLAPTAKTERDLDVQRPGDADSPSWRKE